MKVKIKAKDYVQDQHLMFVALDDIAETDMTAPTLAKAVGLLESYKYVEEADVKNRVNGDFGRVSGTSIFAKALADPNAYQKFGFVKGEQTEIIDRNYAKTNHRIGMSGRRPEDDFQKVTEFFVMQNGHAVSFDFRFYKNNDALQSFFIQENPKCLVTACIDGQPVENMTFTSLNQAYLTTLVEETMRKARIMDTIPMEKAMALKAAAIDNGYIKFPEDIVLETNKQGEIKAKKVGFLSKETIWDFHTQIQGQTLADIALGISPDAVSKAGEEKLELQRAIFDNSYVVESVLASDKYMGVNSELTETALGYRKSYKCPNGHMITVDIETTDTVWDCIKNGTNLVALYTIRVDDQIIARDTCSSTNQGKLEKDMQAAMNKALNLDKNVAYERPVTVDEKTYTASKAIEKVKKNEGREI